MSEKAICFVDMPFGKKTDLSSGAEVDFNHIYETAIEPAIIQAGLEPIRGDRERTGGVIHIPMFGRLLLSDYVIVDMSLANPNVFYEMGIRHTAKPYTTIPIFAAISPIPFDVGLVRSIPYTLVEGQLSPEAAEKLKSDLLARLEAAINGAATKDSPLFQLLPNFPTLELPHDVTSIFQDEVKHCDDFRERLNKARKLPTDPERLSAIIEIEKNLGNLKVAQSTVLIDLLLSYKDVSAWDQMIQLIAGFPESLESNLLVRQQKALALNRRNQEGDRDLAIAILDKLIKEKGESPETLGILGRVHKDRYKEFQSKGRTMLASAALDEAIAAYTNGFEADPRDYYPGVNAITLLVQKGDEAAMKQADLLAPLVSFAVARRGGLNSSDYWDLATCLELSAISQDWTLSYRALPKVLMAAKAPWMIQTTLDNIKLLQAARQKCGKSTEELNQILQELETRLAELQG